MRYFLAVNQRLKIYDCQFQFHMKINWNQFFLLGETLLESLGKSGPTNILLIISNVCTIFKNVGFLAVKQVKTHYTNSFLINLNFGEKLLITHLLRKDFSEKINFIIFFFFNLTIKG